MQFSFAVLNLKWTMSSTTQTMISLSEKGVWSKGKPAPVCGLRPKTVPKTYIEGV
jgi:hypothetical protein